MEGLTTIYVSHDRVIDPPCTRRCTQQFAQTIVPTNRVQAGNHTRQCTLLHTSKRGFASEAFAFLAEPRCLSLPVTAIAH